MKRNKRQLADEYHHEDAASEISVNVREIMRAPGKCWMVFWVLVFIAMIAICTWHIVENVVSYAKYETYVTQQEEYQKTIKLPRITICSTNWVLQEKLEQDVPDENDKQFMLQHFFTPQYSIQDSNITDFDPDTFLQKYSISCSNLTRNCTSGMRIVFNCCDHLSAKFYSADSASLCFSFDFPIEQAIGAESEINQAFSITFQQPKFDGYNCNQYGWGQEECDWEISFTEIESGIFWDQRNLAVISEGQSTYVKLHKIEQTMLPYPYGLCEDRKLDYFAVYTKTFCMKEARAKLGVEMCGCIRFGELQESDHRDFQFRPCSPRQLAQCYLPKMNNVTYECPPACKDIQYSTHEIKKKVIPHIFKKDSEPLKNHSVGGILVQFDRLSITKIVEKPSTSIADVLSKIGSALSLWLGFRLMTFIQSGYFFYWYLRRKLGLDIKNNQRVHVNTPPS